VAARAAGEAGSEFLAVEWSHLIVEEGATLANDNTVIKEACRRLNVRGGRVMISATPLVNSTVRQVNGLLDFLGNSTRFSPALDDAGPEEYVEERDHLQRLLAYFVLRPFAEREAKPPQPDIIWVKLSAHERAVYDKVSAATPSPSVGGDALGRLTLRRKAALSPALLLPWDERAADRPPSSKEHALIDYLDHWLAPDEKALVFCDWQKGLKECAYHLERAGYRCCRLESSQSVSQRRELIYKFQVWLAAAVLSLFFHPLPQTDNEPRVMLVTPKLVTGVDGLERANHVLFLAGWWHDKAEWQGHGRANRPGQRRHVFFKKFVSLDTVDEDVLQTNHRKAARDETLFGFGAVRPRPADVEEDEEQPSPKRRKLR
jgi:SNF2 family DNA or RNA helicase